VGVKIKIRGGVAVMGFLYHKQFEKTKKIDVIMRKLATRLVSFKKELENYKKYTEIVNKSIDKKNSLDTLYGRKKDDTYLDEKKEEIKKQYYNKQALHNELLEVFKFKQKMNQNKDSLDSKLEGGTHVVRDNGISGSDVRAYQNHRIGGRIDVKIILSVLLIFQKHLIRSKV
jgi:hypothetical protein